MPRANPRSIYEAMSKPCKRSCLFGTRNSLKSSCLDRSCTPRPITAMCRAIKTPCPRRLKPCLSRTISSRLLNGWNNGDAQLLADSPDFAQGIAHLGRQFTPADVIVAVAWIAHRCNYVFVKSEDACIIQSVPHPTNPKYVKLVLSRPKKPVDERLLEYVIRVKDVNMDIFESVVSTFP